MITYTVQTDLNPEQLTLVAAETYRQWLSFALGRTAIGGKTLAHPSGRYAASMSWRRTGVASIAIIADESIAKEAQWIEEGRPGADMKAAMLGGGKTRTSKDGHLYRIIQMRTNEKPLKFNMSTIVSTAMGERLPAGKGRVWARPRAIVDSRSTRFRTMSNRPGAAAWKIPDMPAYAPAQILSDALRTQYGGTAV